MSLLSTFITIEGFPYVLGDANVTGFGSPLTSHAEWPRGATCFTDGFEPRNLQWSERCNPLDGTITVDSLRLLVNDLPFATAQGQRPLWTNLTTKFPETLRSTELTASIDSDDMTFTVFDSAYIAALSLPAPVWIESECILVQSVNTMTHTATVATGGRGYLGTKAAAHIIDASSNLYPEVWVDFPWFYKRKVLLWLASGQSGTITSAKIRWRGHAARPETKDGNQWVIASDSVWNTMREARVGPSPFKTRLRGYDLNKINAGVQFVELAATSGTSSLRSSATGIRNTSTEALNALANDLNVQLESWESSGTISLEVTGQAIGDRAQITFTSRGVTQPSALLTVPGYQAMGNSTVSGSAPSVATATMEPFPRAIVTMQRGPRYIPINSTQGLINSAASEKVLFDVQAKAKFELHGVLDEQKTLRIAPASDTPLDDNNSDYAGPTYFGTMYVVTETNGDGQDIVSTLFKPVALTQVATINTPHWLVGIAAIVDSAMTPFVTTDIDPNDWSITESSETMRILSNVGGQFGARKYVLDGAKFVDILSPELQTNACGLTIGTDAKFSIFSFRQPSVSETAVVIPEDDLLMDSIDAQQYANDGMIINSVGFKAPGVDETVNSSRSISRYKQGIDAEIELKYLPVPTDIVNIDWADTVFTRLFGTWGHPRYIASIAVPLSEYDDTIRIGKWVRYTSTHLPDGKGNRGASLVIAQVIEITPSVESNRLDMKLVIFPPAFGYSPCVRVSSLHSADTLQIAGPGYVAGVSDYAGSDQADYPHTANDGGVSWFKDGFVCQLIARTEFGDIEHSLVVAASGIDPVNRRIKFTASIPSDPIDWSALLAANVICDLRFDTFNNCTLEQQVNWPFVGSVTTGLIDGSDTATEEWAG